MTCRVLAREKTTTVSAFLVTVVLFAFLHDHDRTAFWLVRGACTASDGVRAFDLIDRDMIALLLDGSVDLVAVGVWRDAQVSIPYRSMLVSLLLLCGYGRASHGS